MKNIFVISAIALAVLGAGRPAQAQIYSWKDDNGTLVLSSTPRQGSVTLAEARPAVATRVGAPVPLSIGMTYEPLILRHSMLQGIGADLVRAVIQVESAFNPRALSPKGAKGLMQLMPATAARFGVMDPYNPSENIRAGVGYLKQLMVRYENNEQLALAAYNSGPVAVDRHGSKIPPYRETQDYVKRINALRGTTLTAPGRKIYKSVEIVDGQPVTRYTNVPPHSASYQEAAR